MVLCSLAFLAAHAIQYFMRSDRQFAPRTVRQLLSSFALLAGVLASLDALAESQPALRFSGSGNPMVCLNSLQPFGYGLSAGLSGSARYDVDPFRNGGSDLDVMPKGRLIGIRSSGFGCIRMAIDIGALMAAPNEHALDRLVEQLATGISRRLSVGLKVIVDIHPLPAGSHPVSGFSDIDIIDGPDGAKFRRLVEVVTRLGESIRLRFQPSDVALELFNEPPPPNAFASKTAWNIQIEAYWRHMRRVLPDHTLIVAGTGFAAIDGTMTGRPRRGGLIDLRPTNFDANTGYAFHPYESPLFTHQAAPGVFSHVRGLAFPAAKHPGGQKKAESDFIAVVNSDKSLSVWDKAKMIADFVGTPRHSYSFSRYWRNFGNLEALATRLAVVTDWAKSHGVKRSQLMNTEFGVNRAQQSCEKAAPQDSAVAFIKAIRITSNQAGIGLITVHEVQGSCFAISNNAPPFEFDEDVLAALGLK